MTPEEIGGDYELNTGKNIIQCFRDRGMDADQVPGVLVASHAPFAWGTTPAKALENAIVLEYVAKMQLQSLTIRAEVGAISQALLDKHFLRKHGPKAYYGQA
jgi:L-ribulose-5-phosphate 4-epimerase